jgi:cytochrome c551/c552
MGENLVYRKIAQKFVDEEIDQREFVARIIEEASYDMSTTFWCHVIRLKSQHDHIGDEI